MFENHTYCLFISTPHEGKVVTANDVGLVNDICFKSYDQSCRPSKPKLMILRFNPNMCMCYEDKSKSNINSFFIWNINKLQ
jgi:hypothetical protein